MIAWTTPTFSRGFARWSMLSMSCAARCKRIRVEISDAAERLRDLEESLDQCWDLLRQRRAHREFAQDPDESQQRPRQQVEGYLQ